jgi:hypothetical protein
MTISSSRQPAPTLLFGGGVLAGVVAVSLAVSLLFFTGRVESVHAQATTGLSGYAWSDTIGWVNMRGGSGATAYGVDADASGNLSGYAWSDNIGWIKFGGLSSFPIGSGTTAANARVVGTSITGWARACAGTSTGTCSTMTSRTDGWDGWIALSGTGYGPTISGGTNVGGYGWGSDVVGWIDFNQVTYTPNAPVPTVTTYAQTNTGTSTVTLEGSADPNGSATTGYFRYSTVDPGTCNDSFGIRAPASGGDSLGSGTEPVAFDYTVTGLNPSTRYYFCAIASNTGGAGFGEVRFVNMLSPTQCADNIDNDSDGKTDFPTDPGCSNGSDNQEVENPVVNVVETSSLRVRYGQDVIITWSGGELPETCELSSTPSINDPDGGNDTPRTVNSTPTGNPTGVVVGPITQATVVTVTCGANAVAQQAVMIVPNIEEI